MTMRLWQLASIIASAIILTSCGANSHNDWQAYLDTLVEKRQEINVYLKYSEPIGRYEVTMLWQPFGPRSETGLLVANFRDTVTNESFQYREEEKYNSYHTDHITFAEGFEGHRDGDVHTISTTTPEQEFYTDSPLNYYASFQLFDADFDGQEELLVSDWYRGQQGNYYAVYEIQDNGLVQRVDGPYLAIDNCTQFKASKGQIFVNTHDGYAQATTEVYSVKGDSTTLDTEYNFSLTPAQGWADQYDVTLKLIERGELRFEGNIGRVGSLDYNAAEFHPEMTDRVIYASEELLFFADLDFDGTDEMITDLTPFAGSQRDCPAFRRIYRLENGVYRDASSEFHSKCKILRAIEPLYFMIKPSTKEIVQFRDGGYISSGWEVYTYTGRRYRYDRYVSFERCSSQWDLLTITVSDPNGKILRQFQAISDEDDDRHLWE